MTPIGYAISILIPEGDPNGLRLVEKSNWNGRGIVTPRSLLADAKKRKEVNQTGVYVLYGPPEESGLPRVYIGEGDPVASRLDQHMQKKDFWTHAAVFTSTAGNLNKAHVQYLEARLVQLASDAKRCVLDNGNIPQRPTLSEHDTANAEGFLAEMLLCLPVLGISVFATPTGTETVIRAPVGPAKVAELVLRAKGIEARGAETPEGFLVRAGSTASTEEVQSVLTHLSALRKELRKSGVLKQDGANLRLTQDYVFSSPSNAAGVLLGRSANGRTEWKNPDGRTLKDIQENAS